MTDYSGRPGPDGVKFVCPLHGAQDSPDCPACKVATPPATNDEALTLRDRFAIAALTGMMGNPEHYVRLGKAANETPGSTDQTLWDFTARAVWAVVDAMMKRR